MHTVGPDDDWTTQRDTREAARNHHALRFKELKQAVLTAHRSIKQKFTSGQIAKATNVSASTFRKIAVDSDSAGWKPPSERTCVEIDKFGRFKLGIDFGLGDKRRQLKDAEKRLKDAESLYRLAEGRKDLSDEKRAVYRASLNTYLEDLFSALSVTSRWISYSSLADGFQERRVNVHDEPPITQEAATVYDESNYLARGDVAWRQAVIGVPIVVVLADAGFGKTWLLRDYAMQLCKAALVALHNEGNPSEIPIPFVVHAADLAKRWQTADTGARALISAAMVPFRAKGAHLTREAAIFLERQIDKAAPPSTYVLIDGYDEVYEDGLRSSLREAIRWLQGICAKRSGPRIVLASRRAGYDDPFDLRNKADETPLTQYVSLGILDDSQIRNLWSTWFTARGEPIPANRLEPAITPESPLRRFIRLPLIAAFCAWVAEQETVSSTRSGLYEQVVKKFVSLAWKADSPYTPGATRQDGARRLRLEQSLTDLAWYMATNDERWLDAIAIDQCDRVLSISGPSPLPGYSHSWEPVRQIGILTQPGAADGQTLGDGPVMWVHRSVHEYLVAARLAGSLEEEVQNVLDRNIWFDPAWAHVLDFAIGLEAERGHNEKFVTWNIRDRAVRAHDALGWFGTVLAAASSGLPPDRANRGDVVSKIWKLHDSGLLSSTHLARVLALSPEASDIQIVELLVRRLDATSNRQEVWDALAWCGALGRAKLAELVRTSETARGAAAGLHSVEPIAAVDAMADRIKKGITIDGADGPVMREMGYDIVSLLRQRYLEDPSSVSKAEALALTKKEVAREAFVAREMLHHTNGRIRSVAAHGLCLWYGNDIDHAGFQLLQDIALHDADPKGRLLARVHLETVAMSVPWIRNALNDVMPELHSDTAQSRPTDLESLASTLRSTGPAFNHALTMIVVERRLLAGPVKEVMAELTDQALGGELDVIATRDVIKIGGPKIIERAIHTIQNAELEPSALAQVVVGLCFAEKDNLQVFEAIVRVAGRTQHSLIEAALRVHEAPADIRIDVLLDAMSSLTQRQPGAVQVWVAAIRALLLELSPDARRTKEERCALATAHVLTFEDRATSIE